MNVSNLIAALSTLPPDAMVALAPLKLPANEDYRMAGSVTAQTVDIEGARILRVHKPDQFTSTVYVIHAAR